MAAAMEPGVLPIWHVTVEQYHAMIDAGILGPDDPIELLEGVMVQKMAKNPRHRIATGATREALDRIVPPGWYVETQEPVTLETSDPEPDVTVIRGKTRGYATRHPGAADLGLIVEVSESSLDRDRILKKRIYAVARIPYYWIIDLNGRRVEVYSEPDGWVYRQCAIYGPQDKVPVILDGRVVGQAPVSDLLP